MLHYLAIKLPAILLGWVAVATSVCAADDYLDLLDGNTLDQWQVVGGPASAWSVEDGVLICRGDQAPLHYLRTTAEYENFVLELQWKLVAEGGNSGVFFFADALPRANEPFPPSIEAQILDGDHGSVFGIRGASIQPLAAAGTKGKTVVAKPDENRCHRVGQWNHYRLTCRAGVIELAVNGKTVTRARSNGRQKGYIALQAEQQRVHFRNIRIRRLSAGPESGRPQQHGQAPLSPAEALRSMRVQEGLQIELVAAEPLVVDPVAIDFGADGRLWVAEYRDYPGGKDSRQTSGRIRYLTDTDGDGRYDRSTTFLDGVAFPTGVLEWRDGVLIAAAPEILFARDTDGDGRADQTTKLFDHFDSDNFQARINGFRIGLDNRVHASTGQQGASLRDAAGNVIQVGRRDVRFDPDTLVIEPTTGPSQYGRIRDDWGNWFGNTNSNLLFHYPLEDRYLRRNPYVPAPVARVFVPAEGQDAQHLFPTSKTLARFNNPLHFNHVTSACSPEIYRDHLLGERFQGDAFICEPVHNLVTRRELVRSEVTYRGFRAPEERTSEFLSSTDNWFRPAQIRTGPEGGLWVVDMVRFVIEHPKWIGPDRLAGLDVRAGDDRGRIYRIVPSGSNLTVGWRLPGSTAEIVRCIDDSNGVRRDLAHRQLLHRQDQAAVEPLEQLVTSSSSTAARIQALSVLSALGALKSELLLKALYDPRAEMRRHALRLAEPLLKSAEASHSPIVARIIALADDRDSQVRLQVACALGFSDDRRCGETLLRLFDRDSGNRYLTAAVLSSARPHLAPLIKLVLQQDQPTSSRRVLLTNLMRTAVGTGDEQSLVLLIDRALDRYAAGQPSSLLLLLTQVENSPARRLDGLDAQPGSPLSESIQRVHRQLLDAGVTAASDAPVPVRSEAIKLLGRVRASLTEDRRILTDLLHPRTPQELRVQVVDRMLSLQGGEVTQSLLDAWLSLTPQLRQQILSALVARAESALIVLDAIDDQRITPSDLSTVQRSLLVDHIDQRVRERAGKLLRESLNTNRQQIVDYYRGLLPENGRAADGERVFAKHCTTCHRFLGAGKRIGPDLDRLTDRSEEALLIAILDPNRAVEPQYISYSAVTVDGRITTGQLASETATTLNFLDVEGKPHQVLRREVETLASMNKSLMPEGLEKSLTPANVRDLLSYLGSARTGRKEFSGNSPTPIVPDAAGSLKLLPAHAEVYGPSLMFARRPAHRRVPTLTGWSDLEDHAVWKVEDASPGLYEVWLDWMCDQGQTGDRFQISTDDAPKQKLTETATQTIADENWFRTRKVGLLELSPETRSIRLAPASRPRTNLFHLRSLILRPHTQ